MRLAVRCCCCCAVRSKKKRTSEKIVSLSPFPFFSDLSLLSLFSLSALLSFPLLLSLFSPPSPILLLSSCLFVWKLAGKECQKGNERIVNNYLTTHDNVHLSTQSHACTTCHVPRYRVMCHYRPVCDMWLVLSMSRTHVTNFFFTLKKLRVVTLSQGQFFCKKKTKSKTKKKMKKIKIKRQPESIKPTKQQKKSQKEQKEERKEYE